MKCSPTDLKDYIFEELSAEGRAQVDRHLAACQTCREEMERLRMTQTALASMREEELPRRIAFVSDKVFEPKWWQLIWNSGPRLGFASALLVAGAIIAHGILSRPVAGPQPVAQTANVSFDQAAFDARVAEEVSRKLPAAVEQVVQQHDEKLLKHISDVEKRMDLERRADLTTYQENVSYLKKILDYNTKQLARVEGGRVE
jgi:anti-sigma factor RsiW